MSITERLAHPALAFIVAYPKSVLAVFLVGAGLLGWQARHFEIDASADTLLTRDNVIYIQTQVANRRFAPEEFLLVAYQPRRWPVFSPRTFQDLRTLSAKLERLERVQSVRSILNVPLLRLADDGLTADLDPSEWTLERRNFPINEVKRAFAGHPIYEDLLVNEEQTATAMQVLFRGDPRLDRLYDRIIDLQQKSVGDELSAEERAELERLQQQAEPLERRLGEVRVAEIETIRRLAAHYEDDAAIYLGGVHVLGYELIRIITNDLVVFGGAMAAMICVILFLLFRRLKWVLIPMVCCAFSVLLTLGALGLFGLKATVISANFIALQLILTLALVIHLIVQYREYRAAHPEWGQAELVRQTLYRKVGPVFYAGLTTSVGFGSLLASGIQPVIAFGWMMMIAMFFTIAVSLILFPALMALYRRERAAPAQPLVRRILGFFMNVALRHQPAVGIASAFIVVASVIGVLRLDVENSFINYFRESTEVHKELTFIDRELGGSTPLDVIYDVPPSDRKEDLVMTADTVQTLQRIQHELEQHRAMGKVLSVVNFTELARELNDGKPLTEYELTAIYWLLDESVRRDLIGSFFSVEHRQARISARIKDTTPGLDRAELIAAIHRDMERLGIPPERYLLTNLFVLYQDLLQRLFRSQILTLGIVYAVLALTFLGVFRSVRIALIGIAPNALATLALLGLMGWFAIPLDFMTITIAAISTGIAVDHAIHYIYRYLQELDKRPPVEAIARSHTTVGYAVLYTSVVIVIGFSLLAFSDFIPSVLFGLLTAAAMAIALVFALCLLPVLLHRFARGTPAGEPES